MLTLTGAEVVAELLQRSGISTVFAYPGTSELDLCAEIGARDGMWLLNARGDKEAAFMAAGGTLGGRAACAAVLHGARGLTNALGAIADIRRSEIAVLYLVGMPSRSSAGYLPPHGELALIDRAGSFARAAVDCSTMELFDPRVFVTQVADALRALGRKPAGPVLLGLPQDLLASRFIPPEALQGVIHGLAVDAAATDADLAAAMALVDGAQHPVILVDDYLFRSPDAEADLASFSTRLEAPVFQVAYRRGPMLFQQATRVSVPRLVGQYDPGNDEHRRILSSADLLITLEDRNMYPRVVGRQPDCRKLAITCNAPATRKNGYLASDDVLVVGDVCRAMRDLSDRLGNTATGRDGSPERTNLWPSARPQRSQPGRGEEPQQAEVSAQPLGCASAVELVRAVARGLATAAQPVIVDDSQTLGGLVAGNYAELPPSVRIFGSHGGFVGGGLATAVGVAAASSDLNVLALLGDQGFTNGLQALAAASEHGVPLVVLVCNNGASVSLLAQAAFDRQDRANDVLGNVPGMRYVAIAEGFGLSSAVLAWPEGTQCTPEVRSASRELTAELSRALAARRPHLIELRTPGCPEFWSGVWRPRGFEDATFH